MLPTVRVSLPLRPCPKTYYDVVQQPQYFIWLILAPAPYILFNYDLSLNKNKTLRRLLGLPAHACEEVMRGRHSSMLFILLL